jgi:hypothetical protein
MAGLPIIDLEDSDWEDYTATRSGRGTMRSSELGSEAPAKRKNSTDFTE